MEEVEKNNIKRKKENNKISAIFLILIFLAVCGFFVWCLNGVFHWFEPAYINKTYICKKTDERFSLDPNNGIEFSDATGHTTHLHYKFEKNSLVISNNANSDPVMTCNIISRNEINCSNDIYIPKD
jgi:hypothetical protein